MNRILPKLKRRCIRCKFHNFWPMDSSTWAENKIIFWHFLGYYADFSGFLGRNSLKDPRNFSTLAVSKILAAAFSLPNFTIIGAQNRPYGATNQKTPTKRNFDTGLSAGNNTHLTLFSSFRFQFSCKIFFTRNSPRDENALSWRRISSYLFTYAYP